MSFSFSVPATPSADFAEAAAKAKAALEASYEGNDYGLTQLASGLADKGIEAAAEMVKALGDGIATGSIAGHYANDGKSASSLSVGVTLTPAPAAPTT